MGRLVSLTHLSANGNKLQDIPVDMWELPQLGEVNLMDNWLNYIPFEALNSSSLHMVNLSLNRITL